MEGVNGGCNWKVRLEGVTGSCNWAISVGLLGCSAVLFGSWIAGLLRCWVVGLSGPRDYLLYHYYYYYYLPDSPRQSQTAL